LWWVTETDIDGFRHDATKHIPLAFWRTMTSKIRGTGKELFQIGETYGDPQLINSYINRGMLDAQFDFNLYDVAVTAFSQSDAEWKPLIEIAEQSIEVYGADHLMGNITGNQDRARFTSYAEGTIDLSEDTKFAGWTRDIRHKGVDGFKRMRMLQSFILAMPGIPCIYYGDEIADVGGNDPDNRRMLRREGLNAEELATRNHLSTFAHLRGSRMSMLYGSTELSEIEPGVLRIDRRYPGEMTSVIVNKSSEPFVITLPAGESLLAGKGYVAAGKVEVPPMSAVALGTHSSAGASSSNMR
jgi:glycosidase